MAAWAWPVAYTLLVWWASTGLILWLNGLPPRTFRTSMAVFTLLLAFALWGLGHTKADTSATGAYCAFTCALLVWAWQELAFLLGIVTGPHRRPCPPGLRGWARTRLAIGTVAHHELGLVLLAAGVWWAVGSGANRIGWWTFIALWAMRQSAKLNLFLGVRNFSENFLPPHLRYLQTYFRRAPMNPLLPVSLAAIGVLAWRFWQQALALPEGAPAMPGLVLLATLFSLGALEHVLLVLPFNPETLWRWWGLAKRSVAPEGAPAPVAVRGRGAKEPAAPLV
jgi:putative photosynthetic complex assembly protein 2